MIPDPSVRYAASVPDRPFATMPDDELADEIAFARIHANDGRDLVLRRKQARRLAELLSEQGHRQWLAMDLNFPIPKIDAPSSTIREVSSGDETVAQPLVGVCSVTNSEPKC